MFESIPPYAGDPILSLVETFTKDPRVNEKINLSIGLYYDENGRIPILESVKKAMTLLDKEKDQPITYLPMDGYAPYRLVTQQLILGDHHQAIKDQRVATIQTIGGSGALKVGADFLKRFMPESDIWVSDPTWDNHITIFEGAGLKVHKYPYFDAKTKGLAFNEMVNTLNTLPEKSIVLLHPCCHNPTGVDLNQQQWDDIIAILKKRNLIPFMDIAYQGFSQSIDQDAYVIRAAADAGLPALVSNSYSKNFSLYGERCGGLSVFCQSKDEAECVLGQLKATVRRNYSSPPSHGAKIITTVLTTPELRSLWIREVEQMKKRILHMRLEMVNVLKQTLPDHDFQYFIKQQGMFSYTGFTPIQIDRLKDKHAIYLVRNGRMCLTGLTMNNVHTVAKAFADVQ